MDNSGELVISSPRDLAATLRKQLPELPEIWEGGPSKNPAAKALAYRVTQDIKKGIEVSVLKLEWFQLYSKAMVRRRTTIIEEEEFNFDTDSDQQKELTTFLLDAIIKSKREVTERTEGLHKFYMEIINKKETEFREYMEKNEDRRHELTMATIELFAKDKDKELERLAKVYSNHSSSQQKLIDSSTGQQSKLFDSVTSILTSSHGLTEKYFNSLKEVIEKLEGKLLEDFIRMVVFPLAPMIIPLIFKLAKIQIPDGLMEKISEGIKLAMAVDE